MNWKLRYRKPLLLSESIGINKEWIESNQNTQQYPHRSLGINKEWIESALYVGAKGHFQPPVSIKNELKVVKKSIIGWYILACINKEWIERWCCRMFLLEPVFSVSIKNELKATNFFTSKPALASINKEWIESKTLITKPHVVNPNLYQ